MTMSFLHFTRSDFNEIKLFVFVIFINIFILTIEPYNIITATFLSFNYSLNRTHEKMLYSMWNIEKEVKNMVIEIWAEKIFNDVIGKMKRQKKS